MQKIKIISLTTFLLFWRVLPQIYAQDLKPTGSSLAPAPEASALNKFIDIPVSYYTGTPNISAPIFSLNTQELSLPISLNYHASGLKVAEPASWVGAGWVLNAGGMVNRNIRGLADEYSNGSARGYFHHSAFYTSVGGLNITALLDCDANSGGITHYDALAGNLWDFEPDMFYFSMPGGSGKFTFDHTRQPIRMHADDIDIMSHPFQGTPHFNNYPTLNDYQWKIRTPDGTTYTFEAADKHTTSNTCEVDTDVWERQNAWHLVKMEKGDDVINFEYSIERITYQTTYSESRQFRVISVNTDGMPSGGQSSNAPAPCLIGNTVLSQRLSRITSNNGYEVLFEVDPDTANHRADLDGSFALEEIVIRKNGQLVKHVRLNHEYFGGNKKLKLKSIDQLADDDSGEYIRLYDFTYFENHSFPSIQSYDQDYWGYYNGAGNGSTMLPDWKDASYHFNSETHVSRKPVLEYARTGTLKKMTLPTGGSQSFDYELHDFSADTFLQTHVYEASADSGSDSNPVVDFVEFTVTQENSISFIEVSPFIDGMDAGYYFEKKINGQWTNVLPLEKQPGYLSKVGDTDVYGHRNVIEPGEYKFTVVSQGSFIHMKLVLDQLEPVDYEPVGGLRIREITTYEPKSDESIHKLFEYTASTGFDKKSSGVVFTTPDFGGYYIEDNWFDASLESTIGETDQSIDMTFLSVVDVEIVEPTQANHKRYKKTTQSYVTETITFGQGIDASESCRENTLTVYLNLSTSPQIPMATSNGSHVGYSEVKVYDISTEDRLTNILGNGQYKPQNALVTDDRKKLGYSVYYFTNEKPVQELEFPFNRPEDLSYKNGKLLKSEVYAKTPGGFRLLNQQINNYAEIPWVNREFTSGLIVKRRVSYKCENCDDSALSFAMYFNTKNWHFLQSSISRTFENDTLVTESVHYYDTEEPYIHFMPTGSETVDSRGDTTSVDIFRNLGFPALVNKQEVFLNNQQVAGEELSYSGTLPTAYHIWNRDSNAYQQEISIDYGQYGIVEESSAFVSTYDPVTSAFLWGYNHSNMVAAFTNVTYDELTSLLTSAAVSRAWFNDFNNQANYKSKLLAIQGMLTNKQQMQISLFDTPYGPSEMIDVNGNSTYYIYDKFGRLSQVKDKDGYVLQEYELKYHNQ